MNGMQRESDVRHLLPRLLDESIFKASAREFAQKHCDYEAASAVDLIVDQIAHLTSPRQKCGRGRDML
jgi:hypothetical protein